MTNYFGTINATAFNLNVNGKLTLTDSQNTGNINRLLTLKSTFDVDRPWVFWIDENNLGVVGMGYHTRLNDALGGTVLKQYEIKTIADQAGANPTDQRTRFTVGTQAQRVKVGVVYSDTFEIYQGENPLTVGEGSAKSFGIVLRTDPQDTVAAGSQNFQLASILGQIDATDNTFLYFDANAPYSTGGSLFPGNKGVQMVFFRNTNISSSSNPKISIKKGDGTNTDAIVITAKSGKMQLLLATAAAGALEIGNDTVANLYRSAAGTIKTDGAIVATTSFTVGTSGVTYPSASAAPVSGAYLLGDRVWNSAPEAGGNVGWVCIAAGSPGTWKPFGSIGV